MLHSSKSKQSGLKSANIPPLFINASFDNYTTQLPGQRRVLEGCRKYVASFPEHLEKLTSLVLMGTVGTGKTHLAAAVFRELIAAGYWVYRIKAPDFADQFFGRSFGDREDLLQTLCVPDLLHLEETGRTSLTPGTQDAFTRLFDARYEAGKPMLITSNLNPDSLSEYLGRAAYDRIRTNAVAYALDWPSYRGKTSPDVMLTRADTGNVH